MRATLTLDDDLVAKAQMLSGITETSARVREALKGLVARESGRRLALLGGSEPDAQPIPRRRPEEAK